MNMDGLTITPRGIVIGWLCGQPGESGKRSDFIEVHRNKCRLAELQQAIEELREKGDITINDGVMKLDPEFWNKP